MFNKTTAELVNDTHTFVSRERSKKKKKPNASGTRACVYTFSFPAATASSVGRGARTPGKIHAGEWAVGLPQYRAREDVARPRGVGVPGGFVVFSAGEQRRRTFVRPRTWTAESASDRWTPETTAVPCTDTTTITLFAITAGRGVRARWTVVTRTAADTCTARGTHDGSKTGTEDPARSDLLGTRNGYISAAGRTRNATFIRRARRVSTEAAWRHASGGGGRGRTRTPPSPSHVRARCVTFTCGCSGDRLQRRRLTRRTAISWRYAMWTEASWIL